MASWAELVAQEPTFGALVKAALDVGKHKTLATVRRDGGPRISGIEVMFSGDDLWMGSMWRARKALDLLRDPRFALHSPTTEPGEGGVGWAGEAKLSGRVEVVTDPRGSRPSPAASPPPMGRACTCSAATSTRSSTPACPTPSSTWSSSCGGRARGCAPSPAEPAGSAGPAPHHDVDARDRRAPPSGATPRGACRRDVADARRMG